MLTFFTYPIKTNEQQFGSDDEVRDFVKAFIDSSVSSSATTVKNYIESLRSHDNMLLAVTILAPTFNVDGKRDLVSTKTFASEAKAEEFSVWYATEGKALISEMFSGLGWQVGDGRLHYATQEDWERIKAQPVSDLARSRIEAYILNQTS